MQQDRLMAEILIYQLILPELLGWAWHRHDSRSKLVGKPQGCDLWTWVTWMLSRG